MRWSKAVLLGAVIAGLTACGQSEEPGAENRDQTEIDKPAPAPLAAGERPKSFNQCVVCHSVEPGKTMIGPSLAGVFGAKAGHVGDFAYSPAMISSGVVWDEATLDAYLTQPMQMMPGTKMSFAGERDEAKRAEIIAYLKTL